MDIISPLSSQTINVSAGASYSDKALTRACAAFSDPILPSLPSRIKPLPSNEHLFLRRELGGHRLKLRAMILDGGDVSCG